MARNRCVSSRAVARALVGALLTAGLGATGAAGAAMPPTAAGAAREAALRDRALATIDGLPATLATWKGEVLVVNFWASWCAPCRRELAQLDAWNTGWEPRGARVVAVSLDNERDRARRFVTDHDLRLTVLHDGPDGLARQLDLPAVPTTYVLDRDGAIVFEAKGSDERELERLRLAVEQLLERRAGRAGL